MNKQLIIASLNAFMRQRPGLEYANYGEIKAYRAELRSIARDLHDCKTLLRAVELSSVDAETLKGAFRAFSGRLSIVTRDDGRIALDYCTGQYFPTEYRKAVCAVCAAALWDHYRDDFAASAKDGESPGSAIRRNFLRMFGRSIAKRWFN